jgi:flagellar motility protein MotE (MotC chaperone)
MIDGVGQPSRRQVGSGMIGRRAQRHRLMRLCGGALLAVVLFGVGPADAGDPAFGGAPASSAAAPRSADAPRVVARAGVQRPAGAARSAAAPRATGTTRASASPRSSAPRAASSQRGPLDLAVAAKSVSPSGWASTRIVRRLRPKAAPSTDEGDVTGSVPDGSKAGRTSSRTPAKPRPPETDPALFCSNVVDAASDARLAWQMKELEKAEALLRERIAELETKRAEYEKWLKLRDEFLRKAEDSVVTIYSRMRPEAAALQLASMSDEIAAAVIAKLNVRSASQILNEMEPARAAHLTNVLAGMRRVDDGKSDR